VAKVAGQRKVMLAFLFLNDALRRSPKAQLVSLAVGAEELF
jgi:hypothetical protein